MVFRDDESIDVPALPIIDSAGLSSDRTALARIALRAESLHDLPVRALVREDEDATLGSGRYPS